MLFPNTVLLVFPDKYWASIYCSNEDEAIKMAESFGIYNKLNSDYLLIKNRLTKRFFVVR